MSPQGSNSVRAWFRAICSGLLFIAVLGPLYQSMIALLFATLLYCCHGHVGENEVGCHP